MPVAQIGSATISEFLDIAALDRQAWSESEAGEFIPDGEHVWRVWVEHALVQVARSISSGGDASVVGAALAFPLVDGTYCLHKLFVHRSWRGKGIAQELLRAIVGELDKRSVEAFLTVHPENKAALRTYTKLGFGNPEHVSAYYRAGEHRLVLRRGSQRS